jgi:hypothetical protein
VARAKQTNRAEARRRYRQATNQVEEFEGADVENAPVAASKPAKGAPARAAARPAPPAPGRPGFLTAFRGAYHPPRVREDLVALPKLLTSRALLLAVGLVAAGAAGFVAFPGYTGSTFAWELLVLPGQALAPQLVAGFFAPRASYLLGLIAGLAQGIAFAVIYPQVLARLGTPVTSEQVGGLLTVSFVTGPVSGMLFAAAAAWYRRFLALSSPRRAQPGRPGAKPAPKRSTARR